MKLEADLRSLLQSVRQALNGGNSESAFTILAGNIEKLNIQFKRDPTMAISGELFETVHQLEEYAITLAHYFQSLGEDDLEEKAWCLRYKAVVTAHLHRRNILGPAMIDWANCNTRIGRTAKAEEIYRDIITGFETILGWGPTFDPDWLVAVACLDQALQNSRSDFGPLKERTRTVLEQSEHLVREQRGCRTES